jgi:hypothetical protein
MNPLARQSAGPVASAVIIALRLGSAPASADERLLHVYSAVTISPDGARVAAIESDDSKIDGDKTHQALTVTGPPSKVAAARIPSDAPGCFYQNDGPPNLCVAP